MNTITPQNLLSLAPATRPQHDLQVDEIDADYDSELDISYEMNYAGEDFGPDSDDELDVPGLTAADLGRPLTDDERWPIILPELGRPLVRLLPARDSCAACGRQRDRSHTARGKKAGEHLEQCSSCDLVFYCVSR